MFSGLVASLGASLLGCSFCSIMRVFCMALRRVISSYPRRVALSSLPPFYQAVLSAWVAVDGGFFAPADTFVVASSSVRAHVSVVSTKSTYSLHLEFRRHEPACVVSFGRVFGPLYWPSTWAQLFCFSLDLPVIDVS